MTDTLTGEDSTASFAARYIEERNRNEKLREALIFYRDGFKPNFSKMRCGLEYKPTEQLLDDCGNRARESLK